MTLLHYCPWLDLDQHAATRSKCSRSLVFACIAHCQHADSTDHPLDHHALLSFDLDLHAATTTAQSNKYLGRYEVLVDIRRVYTVYWSGEDEKWASASSVITSASAMIERKWLRSAPVTRENDDIWRVPFRNQRDRPATAAFLSIPLRREGFENSQAKEREA